MAEKNLEPRYKPGDIVTIRHDLKVQNYFQRDLNGIDVMPGSMYATSDMINHAGKSFKIYRVESREPHRVLYRIADISTGKMMDHRVWIDSMFEDFSMSNIEILF